MKKLSPEEMNMLREQCDTEVNIQDMLAEFEGITLSSPTQRFCCISPEHNDHSPSMSIKYDKNYCHCFACQKTYTPVTYIQMHFNKTFMAAIRYIINHYHLTPCIDLEDETDHFPLNAIDLEALGLQNTNTTSAITEVQAIKGNEATIDMYTGVLFENGKVKTAFPTAKYPESQSILVHKSIMDIVEREPDKYQYIYTPYHYNIKPFALGGLTALYQTDKIAFWTLIQNRASYKFENLQKFILDNYGNNLPADIKIKYEPLLRELFELNMLAQSKVEELTLNTPVQYGQR